MKGLRLLMVVVPVCLAAGASVSWGTNLTGLWEGRFSCEVQQEGKPTRIRTNAHLAVSELSNGVVYARVVEEGNPTEFFFSGFAAADARHPHKGAVTFVLCDTDPSDPLSFLEVISGDFISFPRLGNRALLSGRSVFSWGAVGATGGSCRFTYWRTDDRDPQIGPCPQRP